MITNKYEYYCEDCFYEYAEQRKESEPQYTTKCPCCKSTLLLNSTIFVEEEIIDEADSL